MNHGDKMSTSILATDGYKFSMAAAGWPLRTETFYYSHRRGGPHYLPFDVTKLVTRLLPTEAITAEQRGWLASQGYDLGGGVWAALAKGAEPGGLQIAALPPHSWFHDREPVFSLTGPSALVSWLEPLVLQLHYRIQVATVALRDPASLPAMVAHPTCDEQAAIIRETLDAVGVTSPPMAVRPAAYHDQVRATVAELVSIVEDPRRIFEVGMRAASCMAQHRIALEACAAEGVRATSNVALAHALGLRAVGTMGHEHVQRYGSDEAAFRAMRDRFPGPSSFLLDTFDTVASGLPTAFRLVAEDPTRGDTVRFDSGDKEAQYATALRLAATLGVRPRLILEDGFNAAMTRRFEDLRRDAGLPAGDQLYGYGGAIVRAEGDPLTRDRVAAVYKLTQSGPTPTMKFGDAPGAGKESIPGRPRLCRPVIPDPSRPPGLVIQEGEAVPSGYVPVTEAATPDAPPPPDTHPRPEYSAQTRALVADLTAARQRHIAGVL